MPTDAMRSALIDRARDLYAEGMTMAGIAELLGVGKSTLGYWKRFDRNRKRCWDEERKLVHSHSPERVLRALERRFAALVLDSEKAGDKKGQEDEAGNDQAAGDGKQKSEGETTQTAKGGKEFEARLLNMVRIITGYRKTASELTSQLRTMQELAQFCTENLSPEDLPPVRRALEQFVNHLREENR